ncbi:unnamed protein product [Cuscuta epithymum]|uniref:Uncharacterized protein n=1 Tax=Cuscuta epithymum TaxID=186058 RepID=A0AAV0DRQ9_9ASTE|nr:unnamed protein product [Cuscuta epithymum]
MVIQINCNINHASLFEYFNKGSKWHLASKLKTPPVTRLCRARFASLLSCCADRAAGQLFQSSQPSVLGPKTCGRGQLQTKAFTRSVPLRTDRWSSLLPTHKQAARAGHLPQVEMVVAAEQGRPEGVVSLGDLLSFGFYFL